MHIKNNTPPKREIEHATHFCSEAEDEDGEGEGKEGEGGEGGGGTARCR